jgi:hypothetical protein
MTCSGWRCDECVVGADHALPDDGVRMARVTTLKHLEPHFASASLAKALAGVLSQVGAWTVVSRGVAPGGHDIAQADDREEPPGPWDEPLRFGGITPFHAPGLLDALQALVKRGSGDAIEAGGAWYL